MPSTPPGNSSALARRLGAATIALLLATSCSVDRLPTSPASRAAAPASGGNGQGNRQLDVTLQSGASAQEVASAHGAVLKGASWRCAKLESAEGQSVDALTAALVLDPRVLSVEQSVLAETAESRQQAFSFDDGFGSPEAYGGQPSVALLGLTTAHAISRGTGTRIAILDTGIDATHPEFAGRIAGGWDFVQGDADASDQTNGADEDGDGQVDEAFGHGTHVAGIVRLTAPEATLLVARVLDAEGRGDMLDVARAIRWAVANGARVINMSLGSITKSDAVTLALEEANQAGVVCVTSAGNTATHEPVDFPASSRYTTAVAAVSAFNVPTSFTSYGDFVEISAPGLSVRSAFPGGGYALWSGTSMAAPFVSGAYALMITQHPDWTWKRLQDRLCATARPIDQTSFLNGLGAGSLDVGAAVALVIYNPIDTFNTQ